MQQNNTSIHYARGMLDTISLPSLIAAIFLLTSHTAFVLRVVYGSKKKKAQEFILAIDNGSVKTIEHCLTVRLGRTNHGTNGLSYKET